MKEFNQIINRWLGAHPLFAHQLGIHQYDGQMPNYSETYFITRIQEINTDLNFLEQVEEPDDKIGNYEYHLLKQALQNEKYGIEEIREFEQSPLPYIWPLGIVEGSYTARSFATVKDRVKGIISLEKEIPRVFEEATTNMKKSMAKPKITMAMSVLKGHINFYSDQLIEFVMTCETPELVDQWSEVNLIAVDAMKTFLSQLQDKYLPEAHNNFRLGKKEFTKRLFATEGVNIPLNQLLEVGENELFRNFEKLLKCKDQLGFATVEDMIADIDRDYPEPANLFSYITDSLERAKTYLQTEDLVTIPQDSQCTVAPYPESGRAFAFAAMNLPGPFEVPEASEAYYYVNPPDPAWSAEQIHDHMTLFNRPGTESITVHEAWPGHYLQLLFSYTTSSRIAKILADSYALIEGWGLYAEEMMFEAGYDPLGEGGVRARYHVGQLRETLLRDVRYIVAIKMHCEELSIEEAIQMFVEKSFLSRQNATVEVNRGTVDPFYLNYTLGKLMIKKLRSDYKHEIESAGKVFSLKDFHDTLLGFGSPPITVLRKMVLKDYGGQEAIL